MACVKLIRKFILFVINYVYTSTVKDYVKQQLELMLNPSLSDESSLESQDNVLLAALYVDDNIITV